VSTPQWPRTEVLKRGSQKRGGRRVPASAKITVFVQITVKTRMKCGDVLEVSKRVHQSEERTTESDLKDNIGIQARSHESRCNKCKGK
jgi:hypothetical protein